MYQDISRYTKCMALSGVYHGWYMDTPRHRHFDFGAFMSFSWRVLHTCEGDIALVSQGRFGRQPHSGRVRQTTHPWILKCTDASFTFFYHVFTSTDSLIQLTFFTSCQSCTVPAMPLCTVRMLACCKPSFLATWQFHLSTQVWGQWSAQVEPRNLKYAIYCNM